MTTIPERRSYLTSQIEKCLRLAKTADANLAETLKRMAADYRSELDRLNRGEEGT